jgi:guanosine-3',5'-bis(diphosphate) 3'-pyrophosphohydrolase
MPDPAALPELLRALEFAAVKHRDQKRKNEDASPYIVHPIEVAHVLAAIGGVTDAATLAAAVLHDTVEDTETSPEELEREFGSEVRALVAEVTDDKSLAKEVRKELQIRHAAGLSPRAALIKLADKICNVRDIAHDPPRGWSAERRLEYLAWAEQVVAEVPGEMPELRARFAVLLAEGRAVLTGERVG